MQKGFCAPLEGRFSSRSPDRNHARDPRVPTCGLRDDLRECHLWTPQAVVTQIPATRIRERPLYGSNHRFTFLSDCPRVSKASRHSVSGRIREAVSIPLQVISSHS